jgi:hypothetical protein
MIDDGAKEHGAEDVLVQDISMHLLDAIENKGRSLAPTDAVAAAERSAE